MDLNGGCAVFVLSQIRLPKRLRAIYDGDSDTVLFIKFYMYFKFLCSLLL